MSPWDYDWGMYNCCKCAAEGEYAKAYAACGNKDKPKKKFYKFVVGKIVDKVVTVGTGFVGWVAKSLVGAGITGACHLKALEQLKCAVDKCWKNNNQPGAVPYFPNGNPNCK